MTHLPFNRKTVRLTAGLVILAVLAAIWGYGRWTTHSLAAMPEAQTPSRVPELIGTAKDWINTGGKTLHLYGPDHQPNKVYLIDFWEYTCVNCLRTLPYLEAWDKQYRKDGLVILGIHTPEFQFAHSTKNVRDAVKRLGIKYPVLIDSHYRNWNAYHNNAWPHHYLVDDQGHVLAEQVGEGGYHDTEKAIRKALLRINPKLTFGPLTPLVRDADKEGAVCYPVTPELYCGYERGRLANAGGYQRNKSAAYRDNTPTLHVDGAVTLNGRWTAWPQNLRPADNDAKTYVAIRYHALDANAVIKPEAGKPIRVLVLQDGKPIPKADAGKDIHYDKGQSYLDIREPRMYYITHNAKFGTHELKLIPRSTDFGLYSFSFSSCTE